MNDTPPLARRIFDSTNAIGGQVIISNITRYEAFYLAQVFNDFIYKSVITIKVRDTLTTRTPKPFPIRGYLKRWMHEYAEFLYDFPHFEETIRDKILIDDFFKEKCVSYYISFPKLALTKVKDTSRIIEEIIQEVKRLRGFRVFGYDNKIYCTRLKTKQKDLYFKPTRVRRVVSNLTLGNPCSKEISKDITMCKASFNARASRNKLCYKKRRKEFIRVCCATFSKEYNLLYQFEEIQRKLCWNADAGSRAYRFLPRKDLKEKNKEQSIVFCNLNMMQVLYLTEHIGELHELELCDLSLQNGEVTEFFVKFYLYHIRNAVEWVDISNIKRMFTKDHILKQEISEVLDMPTRVIADKSLRYTMKGKALSLIDTLQHIVDKKFTAEIKIVKPLNASGFQKLVKDIQKSIGGKFSNIIIQQRVNNNTTGSVTSSPSLLRRKTRRLNSRENILSFKFELLFAISSDIKQVVRDILAGNTSTIHMLRGIETSLRDYIVRGERW